MLRVDGEYLTLLPNPCPHHAGRAAQRAHLAGEVIRRVHDDEFFARESRPHDLNAAGENDHQVAIAPAGLDQHFALVRAHPFPVPFEA